MSEAGLTAAGLSNESNHELFFYYKYKKHNITLHRHIWSFYCEKYKGKKGLTPSFAGGHKWTCYIVSRRPTEDKKTIDVE